MGGCGSKSTSESDRSPQDTINGEGSLNNIPPNPSDEPGLYLNRAYLTAKKAIENGKGNHLIKFVERYEEQYERGMLPQMFMHDIKATRSYESPTISSAL